MENRRRGYGSTLDLTHENCRKLKTKIWHLHGLILQGCFFPAMPRGDLEEVKDALLDARRNNHGAENPVLYSKSNNSSDHYKNNIFNKGTHRNYKHPHSLRMTWWLDLIKHTFPTDLLHRSKLADKKSLSATSNWTDLKPNSTRPIMTLPFRQKILLLTPF